MSALFCIAAGKKKPAELTLVSTSCGHMNRMHSYSFCMEKTNGEWLFSANCFVECNEVNVENQPITEEEVRKFLHAADKGNLIGKIRKHRKPLFSVHVPDKTVYSTLLRFADGRKYDAETGTGSEVTEFFCHLADKYGSKTAEISGIYICSAEMCHSDSYSFTLEKKGDWYLSYDCAFNRSGAHNKADNCRVTEADAQEIINIAAEQGLLRKIKSYRESADDGIIVLDGAEYSSSVSFADGTSVTAPVKHDADLAEAFYRLAESTVENGIKLL